MSRSVDTRERWRRVIFGHDTPAGRLYDVVLIVAIVLSVGVVMLDSLPSLSPQAHAVLYGIEWFFTALFTAEYIARLWCAPHAGRYARSFFGVVDLLAIVPTWLSLVFPPGRFLVEVRILRVLRVFRILKLTTYMREASVLARALVASRHKITVFLFTVVTAVVVVGSLMFLVEGPAHGFTSIPTAMYWAVVTLTTVGYGDLSPGTPVGRLLASALMIMGYGVIAVPTGIVTLEMQRAVRATPRGETVACRGCGRAGHDADARFCKACGTAITDGPALLDGD